MIFQLVLCVFPPLPIFLKYNSKFGKKNSDITPRLAPPPQVCTPQVSTPQVSNPPPG